jgi:S-disulfanyl-L-cysteine oxidoreductase SoxD
MLKFLKAISVLGALTFIAGPVSAEKLGLGRDALTEEIAAWDWDILPDGRGLPIGSGDAIEGEEVFATKCASCHGDFAEGIGRWPELAGGIDTLDEDDPVKTVGSYWPHITTVVDYVKRSMPFGYAGSLTNDETYATVAYILYSNDLIEDDFVLSNETAREVNMPNSGGFKIDDRSQTEYVQWSGEPCMKNCKSDVEVLMRARVLDVTPEQDVVVKTALEPKPVQMEPKVKESSIFFDPLLVAKGKKVFKKCKSCHQIGDGAKNRSGPLLTGIVGKLAGSVEGFKYSKAFKNAKTDGVVWTEEELSKFLAKPKAYLKGTKMAFAGLKKEKDSIAIIEYLKSFPDKK